MVHTSKHRQQQQQHHRAHLYASGGMLPYTTDTFTPAFSHTLPSASTRVMPPPPSSRVHASWWKGLPSISLTAAHMESWASRMTFSNFARMLQDGFEVWTVLEVG
jgi:hypothetical protein